MSRPNFFIVGAPRCGTTSMYNYLRAHPEIFMPQNKEPNFFNHDLEMDSRWHTTSESDYCALFSGADNARRVGEASVWNLYSQQAAARIRAFEADAKIIMMLRNPPDMVFSLHHHSVWHGNENIADFEQAFAAQGQRRRGMALPRKPLFARGLLYSEVASYSEQAKRFLDNFPRQQIHIVLFDHFIAETEETYDAVLRFLSIAPGFKPDSRPVNRARPIVASPVVYQVLGKVPRLKAAIRRVVPQTIQDFCLHALSHAVRSAPKKMSADCRGRLNEVFRPDVDRLSALIDKDLSMWCR